MTKTTAPITGQLIGYARCSTADQNLDFQIDALRNEGCVKIFSEKASGKNMDRVEFEKALDYARGGDTLVVYKFDRLSRSTKDMLAVAQTLKDRGINLQSISDNIDTSTGYGSFFFTIVAAFAELERSMIVSRTNAGLQAAKARGRVGGRKELVTEAKALEGKGMIERGVSPIEAAKMLGLSKATLYRGISKYCPFA